MDGNQLSDQQKSDSMKLKERFKESLTSSGFRLITGLIVVLVIFYWFFHAISRHKPSGPKPVSIVSAPSTRQDVPIYLSALGNVTPVYSVTVKTQINGILLQVPFKEGQFVKSGELLAQIDPRPYEAQLTQYEGNLIRDSALLANARIDLERYQRLWKQDSISQQTLVTQQSLVKQYEGAVKIDQGLIQSTKVNLAYCRITAPIDGRIGLRLVDQGNYVQPADTTGIAVINSLNPITVIFTIPEDNVPQIVPQVYANKTLKVLAYDRQQNRLLAKGTLLTMDNQIDSSTGTVKLKALFDNQENTLFPNQFVNVKILVQTLTNATLVPTAAIQHSIKEDFVYLLQPNHTVTTQPVITGPESGDDTVIIKGLVPGQIVAVSGTDKLMNGARVSEQKKSSASLSNKAVLRKDKKRSVS